MQTKQVNLDEQLSKIISGHTGGRVDVLIRQGIPLEALDRLSQRGVDVVKYGIISQQMYGYRRARGEPLSQDEGERFYRLSKILLLAEEVLGSHEKADRWLVKPRKAFAQRTALEIASTPQGYTKAEEQLERLRHGFAA